MRPCIPRKNTNINNLRAILKKINNRFNTTWEDYKIAESEYIKLISALMKSGIVIEDDDKGKPTNAYIIADVAKYREWEKRDFYPKIETVVLPLISMAYNLAQSFVTT